MFHTVVLHFHTHGHIQVALDKMMTYLDPCRLRWLIVLKLLEQGVRGMKRSFGIWWWVKPPLLN